MLKLIRQQLVLRQYHEYSTNVADILVKIINVLWSA